MNSTSSYGEAEDDRHDDSLVEKVRFSKFWVNTGSTGSDGVCVCVCVQYQQEIALLQEKLRIAALRQEECEARLMVQDQQNQRMLQEYQVCDPPAEKLSHMTQQDQ